MFRSRKILTLWGIDVYLHWSFLILFGFMALTSLGQPLQLLFPLIVFGIVLMHEFGHALTARTFGIGTRDITLYPIGGVARIESPRSLSVREELAITAAGPAVNFALAAGTWFLLPALDSPLATFFATEFFTLNLMLGLFNLVPAFPMDGGRILRALLTLHKGPAEATRIAAKLGQGIAFLFGLAGLVTGSLNLVGVGIMVWLAATAELARVALGWLPPQPRGRAPREAVRPGPRVVDVHEVRPGVWAVRS